MIRCTGCKKFKTTQRTLFLTRAEHEHVRPLLTALHWLPVKDGIIFKIAIFFVFRVGFLILMVPRHHTCRRVSLLYTPRTLRSSSDGKNKTLFLVQDGNLRALVAGRSLLRLPLSGTIFLLTSDTAVLSHSSTLLSNLFSLLLPALNYSNPFTGVGYCT